MNDVNYDVNLVHYHIYHTLVVIVIYINDMLTEKPHFSFLHYQLDICFYYNGCLYPIVFKSKFINEFL